MAWIYCGSRETVEGGAVWVCRAVGAMDGAIEPPWKGLRRVLHTHTAPSLLGMPAFDVDVASAGAGRSPAKALYRKMTVASVPCPGSLARLTFQPKRSHSRRTIDRPSPVPCGRLGSAR